MSFTLSEPSFAAESPEWVDARAYSFAHRYAKVTAGRMHYVDTGPPATSSGGPPVSPPAGRRPRAIPTAGTPSR